MSAQLSDRPRPADRMQLAARISMTSCACGSVWIRFHDRQDVIWAAASLPLAIADAAYEQLADAIMRVREHGDLATQTCEGCA